MGDLKKEIEKCKTKKEVLAVLKKHGKTIVRDDSEDVGCFSIWIGELERIYQPRKGMFVLQEWTRCTFNYSGIPVFFGI